MRMDASRPQYDASISRTSEDIVKEARSRDVDGAMMLAASVQRWLFMKEGDPDFWSKLGSAPEFGARIWTLLDSATRNVGYYRGNYEAWLRRKGYDVSLIGRDRDVRTTMARDQQLSSDYLFTDAKYPGEVVSLIQALKAQLQQEEQQLPPGSNMTEFNGKALRLVVATFDTIGQEIATARKGEQLDISVIEANLTQPLADFGIKLERNPARAL